MAVTFIGYRGSGKSVVGATVAGRLNAPFVDADDEVERIAGQTIAEIFATGGEAAFRSLEQQVMADLLREPRLVIAAGGGAITSPETRQRLKTSGPVIYLRVTPATAEERILACSTTRQRRPALTSLPLRAEIESTLADREPLYRQCATIVVDTDDRPVGEIVEEVLAALPAEYRREKAT